MYKVTEKDLIRGIEGFPIEVVQKMVERQYEQAGYYDVSEFQTSKLCGFSWHKTPEEASFWEQVIIFRNFGLFFERYPKQEELPLPRMVLARNKDESCVDERELLHVFPESSGLDYRYIVRSPYNKRDVISYRHIKEIPNAKKMTKAEIEKELGYKIELINN